MILMYRFIHEAKCFLDQSLILANAIQKDSKLKLGLRNRGKASWFCGFYRATMPAVLVELGSF